jgi:hypothetical protein
VTLRQTPMPARTKPMSRGSGFQRSPGSSLARKEQERKPPRDTGPDRATRALVLERDGYRCVCPCAQSVIGQRYSLQHRKRRSQGGTSDATNLITVLGDGTQGCHARIDSRIDPADEARGYTCRSYQDPALVPVMVFEASGSGVTVWLTADGRYSTEAPAGASC